MEDNLYCFGSQILLWSLRRGVARVWQFPVLVGTRYPSLLAPGLYFSRDSSLNDLPELLLSSPPTRPELPRYVTWLSHREEVRI